MSRIKYTLMLPAEVIAGCEREAKRENRSTNNYIETLLRTELARVTGKCPCCGSKLENDDVDLPDSGPSGRI